MIGHYLSNNNKMCYSTKIQIFSPTKHALNRPPMHLSLSAVSRCTCTPTQTLVFVVCSSGWSVKSTPTHQQREDHQGAGTHPHTQAWKILVATRCQNPEKERPPWFGFGMPCMLPASSHRYILVQETTYAYGRVLSFTIMHTTLLVQNTLTTSGNTLTIVWFISNQSWAFGCSGHWDCVK